MTDQGETTEGEHGVLHGAAWLLAAEAIGKLAALAFVVLVARNLGARDFGAFTFAAAFASPFLMLGAWGLDIGIVRDVARDRRRLGELFLSGLALRGGLTTALLAVAVVASPLLVDNGAAVAAVALIGGAFVFDGLSSFLRAVFRAHERMELHATVVVANRLLSLAATIAALAAGGGLVAVCATYLAGSVGAFVVGLVALRRTLPATTFDPPSTVVMRRLLGQGTAIGVASFLNMVTFRADTIIIQATKGPLAVATYGVAYRLFEALTFVAYNLADTVMPRLARRGRGTASTEAFTLTASLLLAVYLWPAVVYAFAGRWVVESLFSAQYGAAAPALAWLGAAGAFYGLAYLSRVSSIALGRTHEVTRVAAVALVANLALNAYAIPRHGATGAAAVTCITTGLETLLLGSLFFRTAGGTPALRPLLTPVGAAAAACAAMAVADLDGAVAALTASAAYLVALAALGSGLARDVTRALRRATP